MKKTVHSGNHILVFISSKKGRTLNTKPLQRRTEKILFVCFFFFQFSFYVLCFITVCGRLLIPRTLILL